MDGEFESNFLSKVNLSDGDKELNENNVDESIKEAIEEEYFSMSEDEMVDTSETDIESSKKDKQRIDESVIIEQELLLSDSEKEERKTEALRLKELGNVEFKNGNYLEAIDFYTDALKACLFVHKEERAIIYSNRSAAYIKMLKDETALEDSIKAVELNPLYIRARLRRAELYEKLDKLDEALEDHQKILEQDPSQHVSRAACMRLPDLINVRNEKLKQEMFGKLKDLGNMILRPFGLSTANFNLQQDPNTGSYSVNFQQNPCGNA